MAAATTHDFLGVSRSAPDRWELPIRSHVIGGRSGSLFGGVGLAAGVLALEEASGRPVVWATGQYLSTIAPPASLELSIELPAIGRSVTQGRVRGHVGDREIITVIGAAGARREVLSGVWETGPRPAPPDACELVVRDGAESIHQHVEVRMARGMFGFVGTGQPTRDGSSWLWARMPEVRHDAAALALMADYMASAVGNAFGTRVHCTSLDNTIRFARPIATDTHDDWVLCENRVEFVGNGFANGTCLMWAENGELLATASQSMTVSLPDQ